MPKLSEVMAGPTAATITWEPEVLESIHPVALKIYLVLAGEGATADTGVAIGRVELANRVGMKNERSIDKYIRELEAAGHVVVDRMVHPAGPRQKNTYTIRQLA